MIRPAALVMTAAMAAVTTGTYYGLSLLPQGLLPPPIGRSPPEPAHSLVPASSFDVESAAPAESPPEAPMGTPANPDEPLTEADISEAPPPSFDQPAATETAAADTAMATEEPAAAPEPAAEPARPKTPRALVDELPEERKPAPAPAKKQKSTEVASTGSASPAPRRSAPPDADVIKPWWPDSTQMPADQLKLQYAGQVQGESAIALLFSDPLDLESLRKNGKVRTEAGAAVPGDWELGKNPRLAVFRGLASGRYTVVLGPQVANTKGFMLGQTLKGPVYIKPGE